MKLVAAVMPDRLTLRVLVPVAPPVPPARTGADLRLDVDQRRRVARQRELGLRRRRVATRAARAAAIGGATPQAALVEPGDHCNEVERAAIRASDHGFQQADAVVHATCARRAVTAIAARENAAYLGIAAGRGSQADARRVHATRAGSVCKAAISAVEVGRIKREAPKIEK